ILAAAMSTLSSSLNSSANAFVTDFYRPLRPRHSERFYVLLSRVMTVFWGVAQMAVAVIAYQSGSERSVVDRVLAVAAFTTGLVLGLSLPGGVRGRGRTGAALTGLIAGFGGVLAVWPPSTWGSQILAWPWYPPIGAGTTGVIALTGGAISARLGPQH